MGAYVSIGGYSQIEGQYNYQQFDSAEEELDLIEIGDEGWAEEAYDDIAEEQTDAVDPNQFYWDASGIFGSSNFQKLALQNFFSEINRLSWYLFEQNKIGGANCINIFSPRMACLFERFNTFTDIKFLTKGQYLKEDSFLIGKLNERYEVFLPKRITRFVLSEKISTQKNNSEMFFGDKWDIIELYHSDIPEEKFYVKINNIQ